MTPIFLLLLTPLVYGNIAVYIDLRSTTPLIDVSGHSSIPIPEKERPAFKINDVQLKKSVANYSGVTPTDVFVRNGWGNLYETYPDWQEVRRSVEPTLETKTITNSKWSQVCDSVPLGRNDNNLTVSSVWTKSTIPTNESNQYEIVHNFNKFTFNSSWGKQIHESQSFSFPETNRNISKCIVNVYLEYEATLSGDVAVNYMSKWNGSHFWAFDVNKLQILAGLPTSVYHQENISIEYFK